jgi:glycosyltransferase involved in cell wall biosynthesis
MSERSGSIGSSGSDVLTIKVFMLAYNHENFIQQAIDSVFMQNTRHRVHLVIGEDASTDRTREIVLANKERYRERITLILSEKNKGTSHVSFPVWEECLRNSDMVALVEGDDYWTDPEKLERQVEVVQRTGASLCFTNAWNEQPDGTRTDYVRAWLGEKGVKERYGEADLINGNFIPLAGMLINNRPPFDLLGTLKDRPVMDLMINLALAQRGPLVYLDKHMAVRRMHAGGMMSMANRQYKLQYNLDLLPHINALTGNRYAGQVATRRTGLLRQSFDAALQANDLVLAKKRWKEINEMPVEAKPDVKTLRNLYMLSHWPQLTRLIGKVRKAK